MMNGLEEDKDKQNLGIVNEEWPVISEIAIGRFKIHKKMKTNVNVDELTKSIKDITEADNIIINTEFDPKQESILIEECVIMHEDTNNKEGKENVIGSEVDEKITLNQLVEPPTTIKKVENTIESNKIKPEIIDNSKLTIAKAFKFILLGLAKLYVKDTTKTLKPLNVLTKHFNEVAISLVHLGVPFLMTWYLTTEVELISSQMMKDGMIMSVVYSVVFYIACLFVWISSQVIMSGLINVFKKTLNDVANIGKNK
jgi:hypothetical protein